jgi:hypothetical protein
LGAHAQRRQLEECRLSTFENPVADAPAARPEANFNSPPWPTRLAPRRDFFKGINMDSKLTDDEIEPLERQKASGEFDSEEIPRFRIERSFINTNTAEAARCSQTS